MSATADKARYFLEQSVPELKEYERKKIFSADEITSIAKRRSDFEHKINARGSSAEDYTQYAEFEINVEALRRRRVKRLSIKTTAHNGQRRIFFVFDRGTRKFPGDVGLWMRCIQYARRQKAYKKLTQTITNAVRLHPMKPELWIYAASCAMEDKSDMSEARSYMQRALRFNKNSRLLWVEFARLELAYMAKIHARRQVLGVGKNRNDDNAEADDDDGEDLIRLPRLTSEDINPQTADKHNIDELALRNLDDTPAMSGAIPRAIFDAAMKHFRNEIALSYQFFDMVAEFGDIPAAYRLATYLLEKMKETSAQSWQTFACQIAIPTLEIPPTSPEYPAALRHSLRSMAEGLVRCSDKASLVTWCKSWLDKLLKVDMDPALQTILRAKLTSLTLSS